MGGWPGAPVARIGGWAGWRGLVWGPKVGGTGGAPGMAHKAYYALMGGPGKSRGYGQKSQSVLRFVSRGTWQVVLACSQARRHAPPHSGQGPDQGAMDPTVLPKTRPLNQPMPTHAGLFQPGRHPPLQQPLGITSPPARQKGLKDDGRNANVTRSTTPLATRASTLGHHGCVHPQTITQHLAG